MGANAFSPMHLLLILAVILLLFGAAKLPALAKSMGQSARAFKNEMNTMKDEDAQRAAEKAPGTPGAAVTDATAPQTAAETPKAPDSSAS